MSSYISSNANRFYTALESTYGNVGAITAMNRIPAIKLAIKQQQDAGERKDKTGSRTFMGVPPGNRRRTDFELRTYLTSWAKSEEGPGYGPLFQAALGGVPQLFNGGLTASYANARLGFTAAHGLASGQAVCFQGELRFVTSIVDALTVQLNAPFTNTPANGALIDAAITYRPATVLPSATIFDFWSPETALQRVLSGAAVDRLEIEVNGDYHEFHFIGMARDVLDSASYTGGAGQMESLPAEPALAGFDYAIVPGNMGQAWLGANATQFFTITGASIVLKNNLDMRAREFGQSLPRAVSPGGRSVTASFQLYSQDDEATAGLYQAARQQSPISVMFQLGELDGQLMGVYLKSVIPEIPEFDDSKSRLQWNFKSSRAQGTLDDEILVAFG